VANSPRLLYRVNAREDKIYYYTCKIHDRAAQTATVITVKNFSKLRGHKGDHLAISARDGVRISQFGSRSPSSTCSFDERTRGEMPSGNKWTARYLKTIVVRSRMTRRPTIVNQQRLPRDNLHSSDDQIHMRPSVLLRGFRSISRHTIDEADRSSTTETTCFN